MEFLKNLDARLKAIFFSVVTGMIVAHGMALFGKFAMHDEVLDLFSLGVNLEAGRWGLAFLKHVIAVVFGSNYGFTVISMPLLSGFYSCFFLSFSVFLIALMLDIKNKKMCVLLGLVFVTYPFMAVLFAFNFIAAYCTFSIFLSVLGAYLICTAPKKTAFSGGILAVAFSLSIYQAFFPITLALILLYTMKEVYDRDDLTSAEFLSGLFSRFSACVAAAVIYWGGNWFCANVLGVRSGSFRIAEPDVYIDRIFFAYREFLYPLSSFRLNTKHVYNIVLMICVVLQLFRLYSMPSNKTLQILFLLVLFPLAVNFIYLVWPRDDTSFYRTVGLAIWCGHLMVFVLLALLTELPAVSDGRSYRAFIKSGYVCLALMALMSCRIDNICYFQVKFGQQRMISYFTTLVGRIKSAKGYKGEYPVVYLNEFKKADENIKDMQTLKPAVPPYWGTTVAINSYSWKEFVSHWCAYKPRLGRKENFENLPEVQTMPHYPDDGSIKVINDTVVVKF